MKFLRQLAVDLQNGSSESEVAAWYVIHNLSTKYGSAWLGGPIKNAQSTTKSDLADGLHAKGIELSQSGWAKVRKCSSLLELIESFHLRTVREDSQRALAQWLNGKYPLKLARHVPSPIEMLQAQCEGFRYVTLLLEESAQQQQLGRFNSAFEFLLHDLEHADKFFFEPETHLAQRLFFQKLLSSFEAGTFAHLWPDHQFQHDFHYIMSDMNSHPLHLFKYLKAVVLMSRLRSEKLRPHENLSNLHQQELDDFWHGLFKDWGMDSNLIEHGLRINRPHLEQNQDGLRVAEFYYGKN